MMMMFDPEHLKKLIVEIPVDKENLEFQNVAAIKSICNYCGVSCWWGECKSPESHHLVIPNEYAVALKTFQDNLGHFFEHFHKFFQVAHGVAEFAPWTLTKSFVGDFEKRAIEVFRVMALNLYDQLVKGHVVRSAAPTTDGFSAPCLIENLCEGDLEKALKLVPSRELARQLGISDQRLRREIYLARQRALKKRPMSSKQREQERDQEHEEEEEDYGGYFDLEIITCASPPSSTTTTSSSKETAAFPDDVDMNEVQQHDDTGDVINEEWWSIESLIRSDLIES